MRARTYPAKLTKKQRQQLEDLTTKGTAKVLTIKRTRILLFEAELVESGRTRVECAFEAVFEQADWQFSVLLAQERFAGRYPKLNN